MFALIIASEEIINGLFGYGSFSLKDVELTSDALMFFGYGIIAFALVKVLATFFFARDNTKTCLLYTSPSPRDQRGCGFTACGL